MNSIHDLGGMAGFGPLPFEDNEPAFKDDWERSVFGINIVLTMAGVYLPDEHRYSMERIPALHWLESPYYLHWLDGLETLLLEKGYATREELARGRSLSGSGKVPPSHVRADQIVEMATTNHPVTGSVEQKPAFSVGERVKARNFHPRGHTRLPRYVRGRTGTVVGYMGACLYADSRAHEGLRQFDHTYSVRFEGTELWGPDGGKKDACYIDLYESYLEGIE